MAIFNSYVSLPEGILNIILDKKLMRIQWDNSHQPMNMLDFCITNNMILFHLGLAGEHQVDGICLHDLFA